MRQTWPGDRSPPRHLTPRNPRSQAQGAGIRSGNARLRVACRRPALCPARRGRSLATGVARRGRVNSDRGSGGWRRGGGGASPPAASARPLARLAGIGRRRWRRAGRRRHRGAGILAHRVRAAHRARAADRALVAAIGALARRPASPTPPAARFRTRRQIVRPGSRPALRRFGGPIWGGFGRRRCWRLRADPIARRVVGWRRHRERSLRWRYLVPGGVAQASTVSIADQAGESPMMPGLGGEPKAFCAPGRAE